jgi:predicted component of type VI protein secretion system
MSDTEHFTPRILPADDDVKLPPGFTPLRLMLVPWGRMINVTRPEVIVGRHSTCDIHLPLADVSRRHCRLLFQAGKWWVLDTGSLNGIFVNDSLTQSHALTSGDRLRVGSFTLLVQPAEEELDSHEEVVFRSIAGALALQMPEQRRAS